MVGGTRRGGGPVVGPLGGGVGGGDFGLGVGGGIGDLGLVLLRRLHRLPDGREAVVDLLLHLGDLVVRVAALHHGEQEHEHDHGPDYAGDPNQCLRHSVPSLSPRLSGCGKPMPHTMRGVVDASKITNLT